MKQYVIGIDFGTLSGRCLLMDAHTGEEVAESVVEYPHAVMDERLPTGEPLPPSFALQHPKDYLEVLSVGIGKVLAKGGATPDAVVGLGIDFTACTLLPIDETGTPLCFHDSFKNEKHAYVKLWKHHGAQAFADRLVALAKERREPWLPAFGGKVSCEWALPKIMEILHEAPKVYDAAYRFTEAADWLSLLLTGEETHSAMFAGYKWLWTAEWGYPSNDFLTALDPRLDGLVGTKVSPLVTPMDAVAGRLNEEGARLTGLPVGTPLSVPMIDGHAAMPALNVTRRGQSMLILGTSACHMLNETVRRDVDGICGYVKDGVVSGVYTYEAGQSGMGDIYGWFVDRCVPADYTAEAKEKGVSLHALLTEKAAALSVGESGLLALDWWNGNRSVLVNASLSGMILGLTLGTKPEEIYRTLLEATAFGLRVILERYEESGLAVRDICAAGGIAGKNPLMMQIYADVLNRPIAVAGTPQAGARGSAIYASVAAGLYKTLTVAADHFARPHSRVYTPISENVVAYDRLYREYKTLHDYFGTENMVMERLKGK